MRFNRHYHCKQTASRKRIIIRRGIAGSLYEDRRPPLFEAVVIKLG